jgi:hypothetical protein
MRNRRYRNAALSLSIGPDRILSIIEKETIEEMPSMAEWVRDLFRDNYALFKKAIVDRAVVVYKDMFLADVKRIAAELAQGEGRQSNPSYRSPYDRYSRTYYH